MKVVNLKISDIKPYWRNPRKNEGAVAAVKQSIESFGFNSPIVVDKDHVIIAGHTRYKALVELGWQEAPCVVAEMSASKAKEYRIADNKTSELSAWDMDALIPELREVQSLGDFQIYFPEVNLDNLLQNTAGAGDSNYKDVTQEKIDGVKEKLENEFTERGSKTDYIEVSCPHCAETFFVARDELMRQPTAAYE